MNEQIQDIENEVTTMMQSFVGDLDRLPRLSEAVVERVKMAVRQEINEQWLAGQLPIHPSPETLDRVRHAVHDEIEHQSDTVVIRRQAGLQQLLAGLAAAAMIIICVGLIQNVGTWTATQQNLATVVDFSKQPIDLFVEAAEVVLTSSETSTTSGDLSGSRVGVSTDSVMKDLNEAVQEILTSSERHDSTMIRPAKGQGVVG